MKILEDIIEMGPRALTDDHEVEDPEDPRLEKRKIRKKGTKTELIENARKFLDKDKLSELEALINRVRTNNDNSFETVMVVYTQLKLNFLANIQVLSRLANREKLC